MCMFIMRHEGLRAFPGATKKLNSFPNVAVNDFYLFPCHFYSHCDRLTDFSLLVDKNIQCSPFLSSPTGKRVFKTGRALGGIIAYYYA